MKMRKEEAELLCGVLMGQAMNLMDLAREIDRDQLLRSIEDNPGPEFYRECTRLALEYGDKCRELFTKLGHERYSEWKDSHLREDENN